MLKSLNYKVWLDETDLNAGSSPLTAELATAIKNSKVFLSCITTDYCRSFNCNREIEYATAKMKQMITLLIEEKDTATIDEIPITGHDLLKGNFKQQCFSWPVVLLKFLTEFSFLKRMYVKIICYNNVDWPKDENKDEIDRAIKKCLEVIFVL